jgi:hypothetical protein
VYKRFIIWELRMIEEYKSGKMRTAPIDQEFWDEMDNFVDAVA